MSSSAGDNTRIYNSVVVGIIVLVSITRWLLYNYLQRGSY